LELGLGDPKDATNRVSDLLFCKTRGNGGINRAERGGKRSFSMPFPSDRGGNTLGKNRLEIGEGVAVGYLSNFDEDVFISYAHNDDDIYGQESLGWVTRLHQDLAQRVRTYLGSESQFWRDNEVRNNDVFTNKILTRLVKTATFLSVLSPSFLRSEWCAREVDAFAGHAQNTVGILIDDERSRIFKVEKMPIQRTAVPPVMQGTKTYRFYEPHPAHPNRMRELRPFLGDEYSRRYFEQMDELAKDIAALLVDMAKWQSSRNTQGQLDRTTVYVAETTSDLDDKASELRRDFKDRGYRVLPAGDLPYRAKAYKDAVRNCLEQAVLSVHLVGAEYGLVPEGEKRSNVWLQHDLAMERAKDPNFFRLIWSPDEVSSTDARQQDFITKLHEDAGVERGADLLTGNIEDLKTVIHEKLAEIRRRHDRAPRQQAAGTEPAAADAAARAPDEPVRVYVMCDPADRKSPAFSALRKCLLSKGCEPMFSSEGEGDGQDLQIHTENLALCDACLIYYGEGSPKWFEQKLRDLRKYLRGRQPPVAAKAIYVAPPSTAYKDDVDTLEAIVLRGGEKFSPDAIEPFMQKISAATVGA